MGLTQVSTDGVKNDAITKTKIPANQIEASELADNAVDNAAVASNAAIAGSKISPSFTAALITNAATSSAASANQAVFDYNTSDTRILSYNSSGSTISLFTNPNGGSLASRLAITASGNVGIGTTSPLTKLHVQQDWVNNVGSIGVEGSSNALVGYGFRSNGTYKAALIYRDGTAGNYLDLGTYNGNYPILFRPNATEKVRIDSDGLKFNGDTSSANALDDYEEGTFDAINNYNTIWYSNENRCSYTKIGRQVTCTGQIRQYSGSGDIRMGLPFTVSNGSEGEFKGSGSLSTYGQSVVNASDGDGVTVLIDRNQPYVDFMEIHDNAAWTHLQTDAGAYLRFTFTYFTDS